jgi:two-component system, NtrC family, response regulator HydG
MAIIDHNLDRIEVIEDALTGEGIDVHFFNEPPVGLEFIRRYRPQIVMLAMILPEADGIDLMEQIMTIDANIDVVLLTPYYSKESAVRAIRKGATDFLNKPVSIETLRQRVGKLAQLHRARLRALDPETNPPQVGEFQGMIGNSPEMWKLYTQVQRVAPHFQTLLIQGATGTGKELVARALHHLSGVHGEFVPLNCSAVVENLFESELFGHVKGAFTGATANKVGLFEHAHQGTLFLDEIGDMPLVTQAKLLRTLQNQEIRPLGSLQEKKVNVHVIAATHRDLRVMVSEGRFREDLFYRLTMVELYVPPLPQREGDIDLLTKFFVEKWASQYGREIYGITARALLLLRDHSWPGNVRELENVIGHAAIMCSGTVIDVEDLPEYFFHGPLLNGASQENGTRHKSANGAAVHTSRNGASLPSLADREKELLLEALEKSGTNQSEAARMLQISRDKLRYRMKKYGLV